MTVLELTKWLHDRRFEGCRWFGHLDRCDHRIFWEDWRAIAGDLVKLLEAKDAAAKES